MTRSGTSDSSRRKAFIEKHKQDIDTMIEKYSRGLCGPADGVLPGCRVIEPAIVLITGTTGGLGSLLLAELLRRPKVQRVYALNRPSSKELLEERQKLAFREKGVPTDILYSSKLIYVEADASLEKCGLSANQYEQIRNSVTLIIHNAWPVKFTAPLSSFEENIRGTRNLVDLGLDSPQKDNLRFLFTSSITSVQSWDVSRGPVPEEVILDSSVAVELGYGESKYATERIILKSGLHVTSLRIHQIAGGRGSAWSPADWFPVAVKSSVELGALFTAPGVYSWLRDEEVALIILEIVFSNEVLPSVLNVTHPRAVSCTELTTFMRRALIKNKVLRAKDDMPLIPYQDWLALLEKRASNASKNDLMKVPAIKLLRFLRLMGRYDREGVQRIASGSQFDTTATEAMNIPNFNISKALRISPTLANMKTIEEDEVDAWVRSWISIGLFSEYLSTHSQQFLQARL